MGLFGFILVGTLLPELGSVSFSSLGKFSAIIPSFFFFSQIDFLPLCVFILLGPYNVNVSMFDVVPEVF